MKRLLPACLVVLSLAALGGTRAAEASHTSRLRARRLALSRAMSRRDPNAVARFYSRRFISRGRDGKAIHYQAFFEQLVDGLQGLPGFHQSVVIRRIRVRGRRGTIWCRTTDRFRETPHKVVRVRKSLRETWRRYGRRWLMTESRLLR